MIPASDLRVSVALCTYNGAGHVAEQLEGILTGTRAIDQLVISDDRSTDDTVRVARETVAALGSPGLEFSVIFNQSTRAVTKNFEQAVAACTGDIIVLSDQDDIWHEDRLEAALAQFAARPELTLLHADADLVDATGHSLGLTLFDALAVSAAERADVHSGRAFDALLRRNLVTGATTAFRRELLDEALPFPSEWVHDEWLAAIAAATGTVDLLEQPLIDYRQHGGNQIGARKRTMRDAADRLRESRGDRIRQLIARTTVLRDRLAHQPRARAECVPALDAKLAHLERRLALPKARGLRIPGVIGGWVSGRYGRYGRGRYDVIRDLVQPGV